jgi:hypothetical protein
MDRHPCPPTSETLVHLHPGTAFAFTCSRRPRLPQAPLQTHLSCAEALLLRRRGRITATLWASCVRIAFGKMAAGDGICTLLIVLAMLWGLARESNASQ